MISILTAVYLFVGKPRSEVFKGLFTVPLLGHLAVLNLSSALFLRVSEQWRRLLEQNFFSFSYFLPKFLGRRELLKLLRWFIYSAPLLGLLLSAKVWYSHLYLHDIKGFWGGKFIIGNLLAFPFFVSLYLTVKVQKRAFKFLFFLLGTLFVATAFLPFQRTIVLGFITGLFVFASAVWLTLKGWRRFLLIGLAAFALLAGGVSAYNNPKVRYWTNLLSSGKLDEKTLDRLTSARVEIAKGAIDLIEKAWKEGDYLKLLIGWGYGPQKQYQNLPKHLQFINEYESFLLLTEFINGGLLGMLFVVWFYLSAVLLTYRTFKRKGKLFLLKVSILSSVWVNLIYHLFTLFWVPINAFFYLLLAVVERLERKL